MLKAAIQFPFAIFILIASSLASSETVVNNYNGTAAPNTQAPNQANQAANNNCQAGQSYGTNLPPGTYKQQNPDGSFNTVYSTGDKQPYIVDNNCNGNVVPQPYVYVQPPFGAGGGFGPGGGPLPRTTPPVRAR